MRFPLASADPSAHVNHGINAMDKQPAAAGSVPIPKSKRGFKAFLNDVSRELKKVHWPTRKETNRLTGVVLAVCAIAAAVLYGMSVVADTLVRIMQGNV
jgi:preprotein translocase subunit SecE